MDLGKKAWGDKSQDGKCGVAKGDRLGRMHEVLPERTSLMSVVGSHQHPVIPRHIAQPCKASGRPLR